MRKATKSTKSTSPKFKVGDIVWIPFPGILDLTEDICIMQTVITALVFSRKNGRCIFSGYKLSELPDTKCIREDAVFPSKEKCIAFINKEFDEEL